MFNMVAADALEELLCQQVAEASTWVTSALYATPEQECAAQEALCRAMLVLDKTKKERFIRQLQAEVDATKAKLVFLDNNIIQNVEIYDNLMGTGVNLKQLLLLNEQRKKTLSPI